MMADQTQLVLVECSGDVLEYHLALRGDRLIPLTKGGNAESVAMSWRHQETTYVFCHINPIIKRKV